MGTYVVVALLSLGVFAAYGDRATVGSVEQALGTFALLLAYGAAVIPLAYCYSFSFSSPSAAQARPQMLFRTQSKDRVHVSYLLATHLDLTGLHAAPQPLCMTICF